VAHRRLGFWRRFAVALVLPVLKAGTKRTWTGQENLPAQGGIILVANHVSHFDPLVVAHFVYGAGRWPRFLGKASLWKVPVLGPFLKKVKQIPVERGSVEAVKSLDSLVAALDPPGAGGRGLRSRGRRCGRSRGGRGDAAGGTAAAAGR